ncbi:unnamed protein product, partial [Gulo gulo]
VLLRRGVNRPGGCRAGGLLHPGVRHASDGPGRPSRELSAHLSLTSMAQNDSTTGDSLQ